MFKTLGLCGVLVVACMPVLTYAQTDWNRIYQQNDAINRRIEQQRQQQRMQEEAHRHQQQQQQQNAPQYQRQSAPPQPIYAHVAVAWHQDAGDVWATWNHRTEEAARQSALNACNAVMSGGCTIALNAWNSTIAIARAQDGFLSTGWGANPGAARAQALANCSKNVPSCEIAHVFTATPPVDHSPLMSMFRGQRDYFPDQSVARHQYAMVAWPKELPPLQWRNKTWLASGTPGYEASQRQLLERCRQDTGMECIVSQSVANTALIVKFRNQAGEEFWMNALTREHAQERVKSECARINGGTCDILATYDGRTPRREIIESALAATQRREGYFALAWASKAVPSWRNVVLSTGHASWQEAKITALSRCEANSGAACILLVNEEDDRVFPWLALYRDGKGQVHWGMHNTLEQVHSMMMNDCASCRRIGSFDVRKPGTMVHSIAD